MKAVLFKDVPIYEGFFLKSIFGNVSFYKLTKDTAIVLNDIHYQYTMGMNKIFNPNRQVLIIK